MTSNPTPPDRVTVIAVIGAGGGSGASVLAATLADTAHRTGRKKVLLVDADPLGGGLDFVLGWEDHPGHRWHQLAGNTNPDATAEALRQAPTYGQLTLLTHDRRHQHHPPASTIAAVLDTARRTHHLTIVDTPRRLDDATRAALAAADHTLLITTNQLHTVIAAGQVAKMVNAYCPCLRLVIRTTPTGQLAADRIVSCLDLNLAGVVRSEPHLAERIDRGGIFTNDRGPLVTFCRKLANEPCPPTRRRTA